MIHVLQNLLTLAQLEISCSAGELEIESESWSIQPKAGHLASMKVSSVLSVEGEG